MIKLIKSTFYKEKEVKEELTSFIRQALTLSMGDECKKFERNFPKKQERKYAVFVNSGSSANLILIQALLNLGRFKKGDRVGISALTWVTNVTPLIQLGLIPVALDCELETLNVSPRALRQQADEIDGLFLTNALGFCDRIDEIRNLCQQKGIILIEDNCESLGSKLNGTLLGNFGLASTFSFYVGHHLSTIEGGMVCTDDEKLYDMLVMTRAHGWDRNMEEAKQNQLRKKNGIDDFLAKYIFYDLGYNVRPTEINGFLGNVALKYWDEIVSKRVNNFEKWHKKVLRSADLIDLRLDHMDLVSNFAMPVVCKDKKTFRKYKDKFEQSDVEIRPIIAGDMTSQPFYQKYVPNSNKCKNARFIQENGFYFGNNPELTDQEVDFLGRLL